MKTICVLLRTILLLILMLGWGLSNAFAQFAGGSGTAADPYQVATAEHLDNVRGYLSSNFIQIADIDLNVAPYNQGEGWEPIGTYDAADTALALCFSGTYDGNNLVIYNLFINRSEGNLQGLFGYTIDSHLSGIRLINIDVMGYSCVGGLAGSLHMSDTVDNCMVQGEVTAADYAVGGLAGVCNIDVHMSNCYSEAEVTGQNQVGGLIGCLSYVSELNSCYSMGTVFSLGEDAGGMAGSITIAIIRNCYSKVSVSGGNKVGGLVGRAFIGQIYSSYSTGIVNCTGQFYGGMLGILENGGTVTGSYWNTVTSGCQTSYCGFGRTTGDMTYPYSDSTYVDWDFDTIWSADTDGTVNGGYPYLTQVPVANSDNEYAPVSGMILQNSPNPFRTTTHITVNLPKTAEVSLTIYNLKGQQVRKWEIAHFTAGKNSILWDGKDEIGNVMPTGIYLCRARSAGSSTTHKLTLIK